MWAWPTVCVEWRLRLGDPVRVIRCGFESVCYWAAVFSSELGHSLYPPIWLWSFNRCAWRYPRLRTVLQVSYCYCKFYIFSMVLGSLSGFHRKHPEIGGTQLLKSTLPAALRHLHMPLCHNQVHIWTDFHLTCPLPPPPTPLLHRCSVSTVFSNQLVREVFALTFGSSRQIGAAILRHFATRCNGKLVMTPVCHQKR